MTVKIIAFNLGFPDAATFSKAFSRYKGQAPASFRKQFVQA
jgi:transcriptional regulator GlxA family with amidase domain